MGTQKYRAEFLKENIAANKLKVLVTWTLCNLLKKWVHCSLLVSQGILYNNKAKDSALYHVNAWIQFIEWEMVVEVKQEQKQP